MTVTPSKDSGVLPFSIEIPKSWIKNGTWPEPKGGEDSEYQCGQGATITVSLQLSKAETQATVSAAYARAKARHPEKYWPIKGAYGSGEMVEISVHPKKGVKTSTMDWLAGKVFEGAHRSVFFQWSSTSHIAGPDDRKLVSAIIASIKPLK